MKFFASRDHNGLLEQVFAVSKDGYAVKWSFVRPLWRPLTPSVKLAKQVTGDANLELLAHHELERLWTLTDPPRNFSHKWRTDARWSGWVAVGLMYFPAIPLWFVWDEIVTWSGGYGETLAGIVFLAQAVLLPLLRDPLMRRIHWLSDWLDMKRRKRKSYERHHCNPAQDALLQSLRDMPKERFHELAAMGASLAQKGAEQNLRERLRAQKHQNRQIKNQSKHTSATVLEKTPDIGGQWTVYVDDNFHYMDEGERYSPGSFDDYEAAVAACRKVVDDFLEANPRVRTH